MVAEPIHVLGIVGSPRRGGNTERLVDAVLEGAREAGATIEKVRLAELDISPCSACDACESTGECVYNDDMPELFQKMERSQVWVLGTPVYWWGPSAQFKAFVDRWYAKMFRSEDKALFEGRRVVLAIPMADDDPKTARHTVGMMQDALDYVNAILFGTVLAPGMEEPGEVLRHPELLEAARRAGQEAVTGL